MTVAAAAILGGAEIPLSQVRVQNHVSSCLTLEPKQVQRSGAIVKLVANGRFASNTGECGCKSALLRYTVTTKPPSSPEVEWVSSVVSGRGQSGETRNFEFVLSSDGSLPQKYPLTLTVGCAVSP